MENLKIELLSVVITDGLTQEQQIEEVRKRARTKRENFDKIYDVMMIWNNITVTTKSMSAKLQDVVWMICDWVAIVWTLEDWIGITSEIYKVKNWLK